MLYQKKHTKNNKFVYGDIDAGAWLEFPEMENRKIIVNTTYCSCADDNTHIFIRDKVFNMITFLVVTVWPRQKMSKSNTKWNDDRDVDIPSLRTYQDRKFTYGYQDCRDKGHVFKYDSMMKYIDHASWNENSIPCALWTLDGLNDELKNEVGK